jgi:hypothetical protein
MQVCLFDRGERKWHYVHRLVGMHHMQNPNAHPLMDHRNRQPSNNHADNLRFCTHSDNGANRTSTCGTSRFKGVSWNKRTRHWIAYIRKDRKLHNLGTFAIEEDAARAYDAAATRLFGEFALLNFPEEESSNDARPADSGSVGDAPELGVSQQDQTESGPESGRGGGQRQGRGRLVVF